MEDIAANLSEVLDEIEEACASAGRPEGSVKLVAVSKTKPAEDIREAYEAGQRIFGENYAQEFVKKAEALSDLEDIQWHFIGHLQRNKVRHVVPHAGLIQTIDSERLLREVVKRAGKAGKTLDVLVEVNVGREEQKAGVLPEETEELVGRIAEAEGVRCRGLMVLPPFELEPEEARPWFVGLRELRDRLGGEQALPELSMGMSADYPVAVEEGATMVRVGTAIFGWR
jgi:pyridoxal phosphate enzyme (YggS family)